MTGCLAVPPKSVQSVVRVHAVLFMTSAEIRQSFLDFFKSKGHTLVPSSSLMPDSPNLLFTNAGMNQFVPIFLGQRAPDVSRRAGVAPGLDTRAADTQKCIRAGGKHNDLEDVGLDTYHHTFFEMLGNWSFGDYFKNEAIAWAWELLTEVWRFPRNRLYATVYCPDKAKGEPSVFDQEAYDIWAGKFRAAGLDPKIHIVNGGKKDNFWMMGDTGPCGPCSEIHADLTPQGDTQGRLVNQASAECIEIWNLVFIQFNANPDGSFSPLPSRHVDTGMGFERVAGIIQNTKNFADFNRLISNYETDIFRPLFDRIERLSGKEYGSTLPARDTHRMTEKEKSDIAFRVVADHIRTLSFAIADGILPSNEGRGYVLRRILRRAVRYGRSLGFHEPFFYKLADVLAQTMGGVFPEVRAQRDHVEEVIQREEEAFNKTLDRGIELFNEVAGSLCAAPKGQLAGSKRAVRAVEFPADEAFKLYDTYGFPLDLTELMAREGGLTVDVAGFNKLMDGQRARARAAQKKEVIELSEVETDAATQFVGYDKLEAPAKVLEVVAIKDKTAVVLDTSPFYAEMGGQVGDTGEMSAGGQLWRIVNTQRVGDAWLHFLGVHSSQSTVDGRQSAAGSPAVDLPAVGDEVKLAVERPRRLAIQRHHTATHLLHWALHQVVSKDAAQKGSYVGPDKLTFDFSSAPLTPGQVADVRTAGQRACSGKRPRELGGSEIQPHQGPPGHHAVLRREIRRLGARGPDWGPARRVKWGLDGTLRRHACPRHRRNRPVPHGGRIGYCRWNPAHRGPLRARGLSARRRGIAAHPDPLGQGEFAGRRTRKEARVAACAAEGTREAAQSHPAEAGGRGCAGPCGQGADAWLDPGHCREPGGGRRRFPARRCGRP